MTVAQAVVEFLGKQYVVDSIGGVDYRERLIPGIFGIFGHGNVAGVGQALKQEQVRDPDVMPYYQGRNEQAMVHQAVGYARHVRRRATYAVTSSIGPGATNMLTGAAVATTNRLPVLLLPADTFATRAADPVLQQLERPDAYDITVNDAFRPLSRYFDRVVRPEQLYSAFLNGLRVLTDPADTGAVTISLPQDVQAETLDVPAEFLAEREWRIRRPEPDEDDILRAAQLIRSARRPLIIAGGGVLYAFATAQLARLAELTGIPVAYTQAGVGSLPWDAPYCLGAVGSTGTTAANTVAHDADLIIGIGTRYEDFTTASRTAFQDPDVKFVNINVAPLDAYKLGTALPIVADARKALLRLTEALSGYRVGADLEQLVAAEKKRWNATVDEVFDTRHVPLPSQNEIIGAVRRATAARDVVVCAAGSLPGDLHKMWRIADPFGYHVEYAFSTMGYEIPGGLGVKRAAVDEARRAGNGEAPRDVVVMVGDGSYLMMHTELVTAVAEGIKLITVLIQNHGYASIGALSESLGSQRFGTRYRTLDPVHRTFDDGDLLPVDLAANAQSLGVRVIRVEPGDNAVADLETAVAKAKAEPEGSGPVLIHVESNPLIDAPDSESWWDVPVAGASELESTRDAHSTYLRHKAAQKPLIGDAETGPAHD
ncbi:3D-(3,5/4)-trihydroxycyclohexane-1,2-dione acylhydrolase (decyclizing) [Arthrobacter sunyaminii]|uniref:3D-(3,5/4)-trihydroxycyclohexane-1,2-dione acylhydrolase (Decyclizing) n=1 Tax=Arthrobacter sunyaminii TaxID=2816859 RepID=A0A975S8U7_9MICC|nr:3D-(3,5/4)-trihydroxycyclohexane-1,2-dione acylhydrolase (decyclizing) [Arthrobacter sunyaminii]MBO0906892.1 3D-(3,5/4)-trihydroxycyclohexane-1,2-dione acylhydrolase (decyclizing) [Arthrobacter sunyaminii]QWQ37953.1 3D-(3,5/4)-trihydroxycyclohexane-1,2-dione acylhydrolase (decyclizing) [Arthrobacter sunyaminii]